MSGQSSRPEGVTDEAEWWKEAVVYQIYPRSFKDTDGDGIGDIPGIIEKLDYLEAMGVDAVWLNPVYASPNVDMGYDISDYRSINDDFGSMSDWETLRDGLHDRNIRLIMDMAVNHTSDDHEWFRRSRTDPDGPYGDYYIWREGAPDDPPNNWESVFGGSAWTYDDERGAHYLHLFHERQPDLNWEHPPVREDVYEMMAWWADREVDGYRLDVINMISKEPGLPDGDPGTAWVTGAEHYVNGPRIHEFLDTMADRVFDPYDLMTVGEMVDVSVEQARAYTGRDGPLDMVFNFDHLRVDYGEEGRWDIGDLDLVEFKSILSTWQEGLATEGWNSVFLNNHDQPRAISRFGDDERYRWESATLLATLELTLRGTPFLYQGEEIGMGNHSFDSLDELRDVDTIGHIRQLMAERGINDFEAVRDIVNYRSRDNARTPMQWSNSPNAGFTESEPWLAVNRDYPEVNVEHAMADSGSIWSYYRDVIALRAARPVFVYGDFELLYPDHPQLFTYTRSLDDDRALVLLNVSDERPTFDLPARVDLESPRRLIGNYDRGDESLAELTLEPYEAQVYSR